MPDYDDWLMPLATLLGAAIVGVLVYVVLRPIARRISRHAPVARAVNLQLDKPLRWLFPLIAIQIARSKARPTTCRTSTACGSWSRVLLIAAFTSAAIAAVRGVADAVAVLHPQDVADNLEARRVQTQARVLARIAIGVALFAGLAFVLMTFPRARQLGASLLASAGVSGWWSAWPPARCSATCSPGCRSRWRSRSASTTC